MHKKGACDKPRKPTEEKTRSGTVLASYAGAVVGAEEAFVLERLAVNGRAARAVFARHVAALRLSGRGVVRVSTGNSYCPCGFSLVYAPLKKNGRPATTIFKSRI